MKISATALVTSMMAATAFAGEFEPISINHSGSFELAEPPGKALFLFTAPGEVAWVPGWEPVIMSGDGYEAGTVFLTHHGDEETIWVVTDFDTRKYRARYSRITPGSRAGTVEVVLRESQSGGSIVDVTYELTALTDAGNDNLADFNDAAYASMLVEWKSLVEKTDIDYPSIIPHHN